MKVTMTFDFSDSERQAISQYRRSRGIKAPTLATREMVRDFIHEAIAGQWLAVEDQASVDAHRDDPVTVADREANLSERRYDIEVIRGYREP